MNRIRALRKEEGLSQKELGERLDVGQTTVSAWEIGRNEPDNYMSNKMAELFGCSIGYLMGYERESKYRGLSPAEYYAMTERKHRQYIKDKELRELQEQAKREEDIHDLTDEEKAEWERFHINKEWEENERAIFEETKEIDLILERTDAEGRRRAVEILDLVFPYKG